MAKFTCELTDKERLELDEKHWRKEVSDYGLIGKDHRDATGRPWRWNCCIAFKVHDKVTAK